MARTHRLLTVLLLAAPAAASPSPASPPPAHRPPPADAQVSPALRELRADVMKAGRDKAQADVARFRPLCDADGYPLVGNLVEKATMYQPSEFCRDLRQREHRS